MDVRRLAVVIGTAALGLGVAACTNSQSTELDYGAYNRSRGYAEGKGSLAEFRRLVDLRGTSGFSPRQAADLQRLAMNVPIQEIIKDADLRARVLPDPGRATFIVYGRVSYEVDYGVPAPLANATPLKLSFGRDRFPRLPTKDIKTNDLGFFSVAYDSDPTEFRCDAVSITADPPVPGAPAAGKKPTAAPAALRWGVYCADWKLQPVWGQSGVFYMNNILLYRQPQVLDSGTSTGSGKPAVKN